MQLLLASDLFYLLTLSSAHVAVFTFQFCLFGQFNVAKILIRCGWAACAVVTAVALPIIGSAPSTAPHDLHVVETRKTTVRRTDPALITARGSY